MAFLKYPKPEKLKSDDRRGKVSELHEYISKDILKEVLKSPDLFNGQCEVKYGNEIHADPIHRHRRVDAYMMRQNIEDHLWIIDDICFEVKVSSADLRSGCGMNFTGLYNYLVVPADIIHDVFTYWSRYEHDERVGLISFRYPHNYVVIKECKLNADFYATVDVENEDSFVYTRHFRGGKGYLDFRRN